MEKNLSVRLHGQPVGILEKNDGLLVFKYLPEASRPISLSLPLGDQIFRGEVCNAYFGGLLPENENTRKLIGRKFGVNSNDIFSLLWAIGIDCAGAVSFHEINAPIKDDTNTRLAGRILSDEELAKYIRELPQVPLLNGIDEVRLSLAGVQEKTAICLIDNQIAIPIDGCPTTHILKPASKIFPEIVENEYLCLKVAGCLGIEVPQVEIRQTNELNYLLITRYDREITQDGKIKRIHQEDFSQALGIPVSQKYEYEEGAGFKDCFNLLNKFSLPAVDKIKLLERVVFNFLIGNTDAHGKNFSLLHFDSGLVKLAPAYDILCTMAYEKHSEWIAMKIGNAMRISAVQPQNWKEFCIEIDFKYKGLQEIFKTQSEKLVPIVKNELQNMREKGLNANIGEKILGYAQESCGNVNNNYNL